MDEALTTLAQPDAGIEDVLAALEALDEICETDQERSGLLALDGLPLLWQQLESESSDARREATGILFRFGYRKGMSMAELMSRNIAGRFSEPVVQLARRGFEAAFRSADYEHGKKLSMGEIDRCGVAVGCLAYGEAEFESFMHVLSYAAPAPGEVFYDLGSGLGKAVIAAFLLNDFSKLVGVELLQDLAKSADELVENFCLNVAPELGLGRDPSVMQLVQGDFLEVDWSDADIVYANATRYDQELLDKIARKAEGLKSGARLIVTTNPIESECFSLHRRGSSRVSWMGGVSQTFFVFVRN
eukprot:TRINITY_DN30908_c0_g1_i1.p1 TRINITY_DN30908_c0_g1~~TRINITY_DN30908_c0_g1_i1.p1  ORF type:complete len:301 (-),score=75.50 TRINITY_DN30908_c0_g1_i1:294-1196(-)